MSCLYNPVALILSLSLMETLVQTYNRYSLNKEKSFYITLPSVSKCLHFQETTTIACESLELSTFSRNCRKMSPTRVRIHWFRTQYETEGLQAQQGCFWAWGKERIRVGQAQIAQEQWSRPLPYPNPLSGPCGVTLDLLDLRELNNWCRSKEIHGIGWCQSCHGIQWRLGQGDNMMCHSAPHAAATSLVSLHFGVIPNARSGGWATLGSSPDDPPPPPGQPPYAAP